MRKITILSFGETKVQQLRRLLEEIDESFSSEVVSIDNPKIKEKLGGVDLEFLFCEKEWTSTVDKWMIPFCVKKENIFSSLEECKSLIEKRLQEGAVQEEKGGERGINFVRLDNEVVVSPNISVPAARSKIWLLPSHLEIIKTLFDKGCKIELIDDDGKVVKSFG